MIKFKSDGDIKLLRESGQILARVLEMVKTAVQPGISAWELNEIAEKEIERFSARGAFKNYQPGFSIKPFPGVLCISVNDEVVHGLPTKDKILRDGDIVGLDLGIDYQGFFTDAAITVPVGQVSPAAEKLILTAAAALDAAIKQCVLGNYIGDIASAIQKTAEAQGFSVVRDLTGHGVGFSVHEDPAVPCFGRPKTLERLRKGLVLAIEPMLCEKDWAIVTGPDGWTVKTADGGLSAHFEHTVAITENGPLILTQDVI